MQPPNSLCLNPVLYSREVQSHKSMYPPDFDERVTQCPWAAQFKEMGLTKCGTTYCTYVDNSVCRGFNPDLVFDVPQSMHEHGSCIQILRGANFPEGAKFPPIVGNSPHPMQQRGGSMSKKIAVLITDEFEDSEFTSPPQRVPPLSNPSD